MNLERIREYCLSKPHATEDMPFGPDSLFWRKNIVFAGYDKQHSFYYILSNRPSRPAIPFDVSITLRSLLLQPY